MQPVKQCTEAQLPGFVGKYSKQIGMKGLPSGMYLIKIRHGKDVFVKKVMIAI